MKPPILPRSLGGHQLATIPWDAGKAQPLISSIPFISIK